MLVPFVVTLLISSGAWPPQAPAAVANPVLIRVFVQTEDSGDPRELADRRQSVKDLAAALAAKKKTLVVVDAADRADLVLEILDRGVTIPKVVMGLNPRPGDPSSIAGMNGPVRVVVLRAKVILGDHTPIFTNKNKPTESPRGWKSAADDIGGQVEKWIGERRDEIFKKRRTANNER